MSNEFLQALTEDEHKILQGLARRLSRHSHLSGLTQDDLYNIGFFGVVRARMTYDASKGSYKAHAIRHAHAGILRAMKNTGSQTGLRIPVGRQDLQSTIKKIRDSLTDELGYEPTRKQLSEYVAKVLERPSDEILSVLNRIIPTSASLEGIDPNTGLAVTERLPDPDSLSEPLNFEAFDFAVKARRALADHPRLLEIIDRRYGLGHSEAQSFTDIAEDLGLTRQRISQLHERALEIIRAACDLD
jgi:RNA polymerase sigma factor (sigma-70 family)